LKKNNFVLNLSDNLMFNTYDVVILSHGKTPLNINQTFYQVKSNSIVYIYTLQKKKRNSEKT